MKPEIGVNLGAMVTARGSLAHRFDQFLKPGKAALVEAHGGIPSRQHFEDCSNRIDLNQVLWRHLAHDRAAKWGSDDKTEHLEVAERFPYGCLADTKLLSDAGFDDALAWSETALENVPHEMIANFLAENATLQ
jgi:hypothetical protein